MDPEKDQSASPADENQFDDVTSSAATSTASDDNQSDSSTGVEADNETMSSVIEKALKGESDDGEADSDEPAGEDTDEPPAAGEAEKKATADPKADKDASTDKEETDDDDGDDVPEGHKVPYDRFKKVIGQKNEFRQQLEGARQEADSYKQGHEQFQAISSYMQEHRISTEDVAEALQIAGLFNSNPAEAARLLAPKMQMLQQYTGELLPSELQQQVDTGEISQEAAREIVRNRNENFRLQRLREQEQQERGQQDSQQQLQQVRQGMAAAANVEQERIAKADPDYAKKESFVRDRLRLLISQRAPRSPEQATALVREAYNSVDAEFKKLNKKPNISRGPSSMDGAVTNVATDAEPKTMAEAIQRAATQS